MATVKAGREVWKAKLRSLFMPSLYLFKKEQLAFFSNVFSFSPQNTFTNRKGRGPFSIMTCHRMASLQTVLRRTHKCDLVAMSKVRTNPLAMFRHTRIRAGSYKYEHQHESLSCFSLSYSDYSLPLYKRQIFTIP